jgi:hypothetical protein
VSQLEVSSSYCSRVGAHGKSGADEPWLALEQHECEDPLRVRRREEDRHRRAVHVAEQRGPLDADSVEHRAHVVHALLERGHAADAVGRTRAALVESDDSHPPRQLVEAAADRLVVELDGNSRPLAKTRSNGPVPKTR